MRRLIITLAIATCLAGCEEPEPEPVPTTEPEPIAPVSTAPTVVSTEAHTTTGPDGTEVEVYCERVCVFDYDTVTCEDVCEVVPSGDGGDG